jgi:hypothetical protein
MRDHMFVLAPFWPLFTLVVIFGAVWVASL